MRSKSSEAERERMEPQERNERVCGGCSDDMLILMKTNNKELLRNMKKWIILSL